MAKKWLRTLFLVALLGITLTTPAQGDDCPALVQSALDLVGESCANLGRNQLCYGHGNIDVLNFERAPLPGFDRSGDRSDIAEVYALTTAAMDVKGDIWGVAVLALQANLPDTLPGQNVTFIVYGNIELVSDRGTSQISAPMQAFRLTTGVGEPACAEAPRDGILIQAPTETTVNFLINGIEIEVGSTALLQLNKENVLGVNTFDGNVRVTSAGETQTAAPGQRIDVSTGNAPAEPIPYDDGVLAAPVELLPEAVSIPPPDGIHLGIVTCELNGGEQTVSAGQPLALRLGWADEDQDHLNAFTAITTQTIQVNGESIAFWGTTSNETETGFARHWWWVITDPQPGRYEAKGYYKVPQDWTDTNGAFTAAGTYTYACTITVE